MLMKKTSEIVIVFDFDSTIIEMDSDNWLLGEFGAIDKFYQLLPTTPWNPLMDRMMKELHSEGKTMDDIVEVLKQTPMHHRIAPAIEAAHALGCDLRILSDANMFFLETIVKHHGLDDYFSEIDANPSYVNEEGRLRISPYHNFVTSPHGCSLCPPNMCKGVVLERIQRSVGKEGKRIIYLGDGSNDYCPSLKLKESDYVMPRKNFTLFKLISENPSLVKAEIHGWSDGEELERVLLQIIDTICVEEKNNTTNPSKLIAADCKLGTINCST
ncbi:Inorganic pyrophosphatase [Quillaja saponaria]|uniref:Inorganic pyrophosphatase n=1 Tax=Quillaja saponaria TaxID=32244 RepID=A0AAD7LRU0_QUISA|nr:Inorganic pyrophosphatase [Quillaja saponaria]